MSRELGLSLEGTVSPRVLAKVVYAGATASFPQAEEDLRHLADLAISSERIRRACHRVGDERIGEHEAEQSALELGNQLQKFVAVIHRSRLYGHLVKSCYHRTQSK